MVLSTCVRTSEQWGCFSVKKVTLNSRKSIDVKSKKQSQVSFFVFQVRKKCWADLLIPLIGSDFSEKKLFQQKCVWEREGERVSKLSSHQTCVYMHRQWQYTEGVLNEKSVCVHSVCLERSGRERHHLCSHWSCAKWVQAATTTSVQQLHGRDLKSEKNKKDFLQRTAADRNSAIKSEKRQNFFPMITTSTQCVHCVRERGGESEQTLLPSDLCTGSYHQEQLQGRWGSDCTVCA
jgi:hypothetical protein